MLATKKKINTAAIFQDGRLMGPCYMILLKFHGANCEINLKFGRSVPSRSVIQMKMLAKKKNQYGGHFSRWLPNGPLFYSFAENPWCRLLYELKIWQKYF